MLNDCVCDSALFYAGRRFPPEKVYTASVGNEISYWYRYTRRQLEVLWRYVVCWRLCYPIRYTLRHVDVTSRKQDLGQDLIGKSKEIRG